MPQTHFNHAKHASVKCDDCHHATQSRETVELLMPAKATCVMCHTVQGTNAAARLGPNLTHVGARLSQALIRESILKPDAKIAKGFEKFAGVMPKTFGDQLTGAQLEALVQFLSSHK